MFKGLSLRFKLILAFLAIAGLLAGVSAYQIRAIQNFNAAFVRLADGDFIRAETLDDLKLLTWQIRDRTFEYQHMVFEGERVDIKKERAAIAELGQRLAAQQSDYRAMVKADKADIPNDRLEAAQKAADDVIKTTLAVVDATPPGSNALTPERQEVAMVEAQERLDTALNQLIAAEEKNVATSDQIVDGSVAKLMDTVVGLAFTTTALAVTMGVFVSTWIGRGIARLRIGSSRLANGDFLHPIPVQSKDELGELAMSFNSMASRLKEAYQRQAISQQRDEAILQSLGEGLIVIDEAGKIALINPAALNFLDLTDPAQAVGKPIQEAYQLYDPADKTDTPLPIDKRPSYIAFHQIQSVNEVYGFHKPDGKKYLLNITATPIKLGDKPIGAITVLRDVTKEKEVDRMKTEFISLASHQLRTPLSAIKWYSEMLVAGDAGDLQPEQMDFAKSIADSTERMIALVNALLNISRIESGRIMVDPKPTDLKELVSGIVTDLKGKTEEKKQTLIISVHDELPKIMLDPRLIGQVYLNLLTNAIKYTPKGGEISVFISRKDAEIVSQVTDNGYGIPKEQQGRIFQKFFRAANAVKVETDGTGLGLYLIKAVIESSGGKIWFKSEENKGTTFWFSIPVTGMKRKEGEVTLDV